MAVVCGVILGWIALLFLAAIGIFCLIQRMLGNGK